MIPCRRNYPRQTYWVCASSIAGPPCAAFPMDHNRSGLDSARLAGVEYRSLAPRATLGDLLRVTPWLWVNCGRCQHHAPLARGCGDPLGPRCVERRAAAAGAVHGLRQQARDLRVIRRGGRLSVFDFDWETQIIDSPYTQTTRQITRSFCDSFKNGWIGRRLPRLFRQHAMIDISITPQTIILNFPFAELLLGGHLTRAQQTGVVPSAMLNNGGPSYARRTKPGRSFLD